MFNTVISPCQRRIVATENLFFFFPGYGFSLCRGHDMPYFGHNWRLAWFNCGHANAGTRSVPPSAEERRSRDEATTGRLRKGEADHRGGAYQNASPAVWRERKYAVPRHPRHTIFRSDTGRAPVARNERTVRKITRSGKPQIRVRRDACKFVIAWPQFLEIESKEFHL